MRVLILGGTGAVGRWVGSLAAESGHEVVAASRHIASASSTAETIPDASAMIIDLDDSRTRIPGGINVVVDCTGTDRLGTARLAARSGADFIDISATSRYVMQLAGSSDLFRNAERRCVFGFGLAPGLSTMLARVVHDPSNPAPIDVHAVLDTGDEHGDASAAFTLDMVTLALEQLRCDTLPAGVHLAAHVTDLNHSSSRLARHGIAVAIET